MKGFIGFYKGTKSECEDYNQIVSAPRNYIPPTTWCYPEELPNNDGWVVIAHPDYSSSMTLIPNLEEWYS